MANYVDTWHLAAPMPDRFILTCYGIPNETQAREIAQRILDSGLVEKVELTHTTTATQQARWVNSNATLRK